MALQALHSIYWPGDGVEQETPVAPTGYMWGSVIAGLAWWLAAIAGVPMPVVMATVVETSRERTLGQRLVKRFWQWSTPYRKQIPDRWWLLLRLVRLLWSPEFERAREAVRAVATTPGMREKRMWAAVFGKANTVPGVGENLVRHLAAVDQFGGVRSRQGHVRSAALELAYLALKER